MAAHGNAVYSKREMSFCSDFKEELLEGAPRRRCCKNAYAAGLLYDVQEMRENCLVQIVTNLAVRRECARVFREKYKRTALLNGSALLYASEEMYRAHMHPPVFECEACKVNFMRGLVLSTATLNDPDKSFHMEFRIANAEKVPYLAEFFEENKYHPGCRTIKGGGIGVYFKSGNAIEGIIGLSGANSTLFEYMNKRIERGIRNDENRATNCVTRNIKRCVTASAKYCEAITRLEKSGTLLSLPSELRETAALRIENPEVSLSELALMHNPPITKSGLNNRLLKILAAAGVQAEKK